MRMKSRGPSLVPSEAETPVATLDSLLNDLEKQLPGMAFEGTFSAKDQLSLLGFALSNSRSLRYNVDFLKALKVLRLAQKHGGHPYGFGLYFAHAAKDNLQNYDEIVKLKAKFDPDNMMNPGKIIEPLFSSVDKITTNNEAKVKKVYSHITCGSYTFFCYIIIVSTLGGRIT